MERCSFRGILCFSGLMNLSGSSELSFFLSVDATKDPFLPDVIDPEKETPVTGGRTIRDRKKSAAKQAEPVRRYKPTSPRLQWSAHP
jgi:hypothetical protein